MDGGHQIEARRHIGFAPIIIPQLKVSVFGLGRIGAVTAACLAKLGHRVLAVDGDTKRTAEMQKGKTNLAEPGLAACLQRGVHFGLISAADDAEKAVLNTNISMIATSMQIASDGTCDMRSIRNISATIGRALRQKNAYHLVVLRCSVPPGTTVGVVAAEIEKASGKQNGLHFGVCFNPEFLREGSAVDDFFIPPRTVVGADDTRAQQMMAMLYCKLNRAPIFTDVATAEMVKSVDALFRAMKIVFTNEMGRLCKAMHLDGREVMDIFAQGLPLNKSLSSSQANFAFGGPSLPQDVRAVKYMADKRNVSLPMVTALAHSNTDQIFAALQQIEETGCKSVGFLGLCFKPNTGDIRESPFLTLMLLLEEGGFDVQFHDRNFPHGNDLTQQLDSASSCDPRFRNTAHELTGKRVRSLRKMKSKAEVLVVCHRVAEYQKLVEGCGSKNKVIDLTCGGCAATEALGQDTQSLRDGNDFTGGGQL